MWTTIECAGHPRDMGLAQGAGARSAIHAELSNAGLSRKRSRIPTLRALTQGRLRGRGAGREFFRHFAHQAERLEGLAFAADVPVDSLLELHLRVRAGGAAGGLLSRRTSLRARTVGGRGEGKSALLERSLPCRLPGESGWIVRESRPEVGFRSVEIGLPWLVSAVAGVNEAGLAVVAGPLLWGRQGYEGASPSFLLAQDCLQRFGDLEGALDWCRKRPVEGEQSFVLADASGAVATVISNGRERRVQSGDGELHLEGGDLPDPDRIPALPEGSARDRVLLDPKARRLQLDAAAMAIEIGL
ncbi:MAG TPA: hypothetical protein ENI85_02265 [Deltaproteobacteria bacterium]|nr:hypothetical protein [Deltaproteobacteria bacterium]